MQHLCTEGFALFSSRRARNLFLVHVLGDEGKPEPVLGALLPGGTGSCGCGGALGVRSRPPCGGGRWRGQAGGDGRDVAATGKAGLHQGQRLPQSGGPLPRCDPAVSPLIFSQMGYTWPLSPALVPQQVNARL